MCDYKIEMTTTFEFVFRIAESEYTTDWIETSDQRALQLTSELHEDAEIFSGDIDYDETYVYWTVGFTVPSGIREEIIAKSKVFNTQNNNVELAEVIDE